MVPSLVCVSELVLAVLIQKTELRADVIKQNLQRWGEVFYIIFMWKYKKIMKWFRLSKWGERSASFLWLLKRYVQHSECTGFLTRMGVGCKLPTYTHKLGRFPVIFLMSKHYFIFPYQNKSGSLCPCWWWVAVKLTNSICNHKYNVNVLKGFYFMTLVEHLKSSLQDGWLPSHTFVPSAFVFVCLVFKCL